MEAVAPVRERAEEAPTRSLRAIVGPTASGKTRAGVLIAERLGAEVIACDSMTVYRGMDVGTAKPSPDERARVQHHVIDLVDPTDLFSVVAYQEAARDAIARVAERGKVPLLVGGSGLYFRAVVDDLDFPGTDARIRRELEAEGEAIGPRRLHERLATFDPEAASRIEPENLRRTVRALEVAALTGRLFSSFARAWDRYPPGRVVVAGIRLSSEALRARIEDRVGRQYEGGLVEEARRLLERGFGPFLTASQAIGYREVVDHLEGRRSLEEAAAVTIARTKALARRQMAWFRRDPRIRWFDAGEEGAAGILMELERHLR